MEDFEDSINEAVEAGQKNLKTVGLLRVSVIRG
jgi:hypothetical protein